MKCNTIHLKDEFEFLGANQCDPVVETYLPSNMTEVGRENQKRPCLVLCPGGGYSFCSQREAEPIALNFLTEGYNVFVLHYSVSPHRFPTQIREVAGVIELIYKNKDDWNCDTSKIIIMGFSAGGHLAANYSNKYDCKEVREVFPESKPVKGSVLCYPVITANPKYSHKGSFEELLGHYPETNEEQKQYSCDMMVSDSTPPAFIWHTSTDECVPVMNSLLYAEQLTIHKIPYELHIYPYGDHGLATADKNTCDYIDEKTPYVKNWIEDVKKWLELMF